MILVVLPLLVTTLALVTASSFYTATAGIMAVTEDFLRFKARQLEQYADGQWQLLVENDLTNQPEMRRAARRGVQSYATSIIERDSELIIAVEPDGAVAVSTTPLDLDDADRSRLRALVQDDGGGGSRRGAGKLTEFLLSGTERVGVGFWFEPFDLYYLVSEERSTFFGDVVQLGRQAAIILLLAIGLGVAVLFVFSGFLTKPLRQVVSTMTNVISNGDLTARAEIHFQDEIGTVAHTFNLMIGELQRAYEQIKGYAFDAVLAQKKEQRIRHIFQKYVPQDLIDRFFENPEKMLVGDNRELAVLFCDIRGFTSISEHLPPADLVDSLNRYFTYMVDIIMEHHGIVDKYIGDAIMAFFGAPLSRGDEPEQAVKTAVGMVKALDAFNQEQQHAGKPGFRIGIGITFGEVTVGNIGTDRKMDYTVIGDTANLASRLESLTKYYHVPILVGESVRDRVPNTFPWRLVDTVAVKGRKGGVRLYTTRADLSPAQRHLWTVHNEAMTLYYAREFARAAHEFARILEHDPEDNIAQILVERAERYQDTPPPSDWDGIEVMTEK